MRKEIKKQQVSDCYINTNGFGQPTNDEVSQQKTSKNLQFAVASAVLGICPPLIPYCWQHLIEVLQLKTELTHIDHISP